ncbi:MAG: threonine ammonia-lyase, biosynthetic [bacterium]
MSDKQALCTHAELIRGIAQAKVYPVAKRTPVSRAELLSDKLGVQIFLKREDLQHTHSFKVRGAANRLSRIDADCRGVIAASAGNHAQGVALSAKGLDLPAVIVMPKTTPRIKVDSVKRLGAEVILYGDNFDQARDYCIDLAESRGLCMIHPFDDLDVIAGQGTVAKELMNEHPDLDVVFIPVGGGGLLAGMAAWIKSLYPRCKVIAVEAAESACFKAAFEAGKRVSLTTVDSFADGVAVRQIGEHPFNIAKNLVDEVISVDADAICGAVKVIFENTRSIAEPAGALGLAGLKKWVKEQGDLPSDCKVATVVSGANIDFHNLRYISERTELGEHREALFVVTIPEQPGAFLDLCEWLGKRNITEFNYRYHDQKQAQVFLGVHTPDGWAERPLILQSLNEKDYPVVDITDNETAKLHLRYLMGGHAKVSSERYLRFEFPERPGALLQFLQNIGQRWNISLFHYRNHGAAMGQVLVGFQVGAEDGKAFKDTLEEINYPYWDETDNPAMALFLAG